MLHYGALISILANTLLIILLHYLVCETVESDFSFISVRPFNLTALIVSDFT